MGFQDSSWNIPMGILVILAASVFEISCGKTERPRKMEVKTLLPYPCDYHQRV